MRLKWNIYFLRTMIEGLDMEGEDGQDDVIARPYQDILTNQAKKRNSIIYLPTGSGKTFIAVMLIKELSPALEEGKHTFFMVNTVALVSQQAAYIKRHSHYTVGEYSGDMNVDFWSRDKWLHELNEHKIMVMTSQIFLNLVTCGIVTLQDVNLLVFDECHHGVNDQPMRLIMQNFERCPIEKQPRVLGLTATLLNKNCSAGKVAVEVRSLETTFQSTVATCENMDEVCFYATNPNELTVSFEEGTSGVADDVLRLALNLLSKAVDFVEGLIFDCDKVEPQGQVPSNMRVLNEHSDKMNKKLRNLLLDVEIHINMLGMFGGSFACLAHIIQLERLRKKAEDMLTKQVFTSLMTTLTAIRKLFEDKMSDCTVKSQVRKYSSYKILTLIEILKKYMPPDIAISPEDADFDTDSLESKKQKFCTLIFVERRFTAKILFYVLKALCEADEDFKHISPDFIVGFNNNPFNDTREGAVTKKWSYDCLNRFQTGEKNLLVASDVLEEGLDIQKCNLVVKFDLPKNYRSYVQSKGRARHRTSHYVLMIPASDKLFIQKYTGYINTEKTLEQLLVGRSEERSEPSEQEIAKELYDHLVPPYSTMKATVSLASSIPLLHRYCSMLPQDKFTQLAPTWFLVNSSILKICLQLPMNSPLTEIIEGQAMINKKLAKRSAALEACKRLHQIGELNDSLLPIGRSSAVLDSSDLFPLYLEENDEADEERTPRGSKKRKQYYTTKFSGFLSSCRPTSNVDLYLHVIEMKPVYLKPYDNNRKLVFYDLLNCLEGFAILSRNAMPQICDFPIYMNVGELSVHILPNEACIELTEEQVDSLEKFNTMIFRQVLKLMKPFMTVDKENKENSYFIVPTKIGSHGQHEIDWDIANSHGRLPEVVEPTEGERSNLVISEELFGKAVVAPWYRNTHPDQSYIVTDITSLTTRSPFPSNDYGTYEEYYYKKYKLDIIKKDQSLLEVKAISNKINCLRPRGNKVSHATSKRKRHELQEDFEENLIGELCMRYEFPSVLWLKATCLPTILHRISHILLAEELRQKIARDIGVGRLDLQNGEAWQPITVDRCIATEGDSAHNSPQHMANIIKKLNFMRMTKKKMDPQTASLFDDIKEPVDIDRHMEEVTLVEVFNYDDFIRQPLKKKELVPHVESSSEDVSNVELGPLHWDIEILNVERNDIGPELHEVVQALTSASSNDIFNLERLETLGDSFLKLMSSFYLYMHYLRLDEGKLTQVKGKLIGNRNLYYCGVKQELGGYMKVHDFVPTSDWIAPGFCVDRHIQQLIKVLRVSPNVLYELILPKEEQISGTLSEETKGIIIEKLRNTKVYLDEMHSSMESFVGVQTVSDKTIADGVEALIGVYLKGSGIRGALRLLGWLQILPADEASPEKLLDVQPPTADIKMRDQNQSGDIYLHLTKQECKAIEDTLQYTFKDHSYLLQALTHASYSPNRVTECYQRLEFLGDAVLDFLVTCHIYESCGKLNPGQLTDLRSALVNNVTFASLAVRYGFHKFMKYSSTKLMDMVDRFVKFQEDNGHSINEEVLILLEESETNIAEAIDVPKVLGDLFESIAGAIYLDSGLNLKEVWRVYYRLMRKEIRTFSKDVPKQPVRLLYENAPQRPEFMKSRMINNLVMVTVKLLVDGKRRFFHGFGNTKLQAKRAASKCALKSLSECF